MSDSPLAAFSNEEILLVAMALNRGATVQALERRDDEQAALLTRVLGYAIDEELLRRKIDYRGMASSLFERVLRTLDS